MQHKRKKKEVILLMMILSLLLVQGCKNRKGWIISLRVSISPDDRWMAFTSGPSAKNGNMIMMGQERVFILDIAKESEPILVDQSKAAQLITWKPNTVPHELYILTQDPSEINNSELKGFKISENTTLFSLETLGDIPFDLPLKMEWNPKGNLLVSFHIFSGLRFSYNGGKTFIKSDIKVAGPDNLVWIDDERFYMRDNLADEDRIIEISIHEGQAENIKTIASEKSGQTKLIGSVDNEIAYAVNNSIYIGDRLIYENDTKMGWAFTDGYFIVLQEQPRQKDNSILIMDKNGTIIKKKALPKETVLVGLSAQRKAVYMIEDLRVIKSWQFMDSNEIKALYRISR